MIEYRQMPINFRAGESRKIEGYGSVFESESEDLGFIETIDANAITAETIKRSDVFATFNHDTNKVLARSKYGSGSLELNVDETGLHYRFDAPHNDLGNTVLEHIERGDIDSSSFAFTVAKDKWGKRADGKMWRRILEVDKLYDIAPVWSPAYPEAKCLHRNKPSDYEMQLRSLENTDDSEDMNENDEKLKALEEENKALREQLEAQKEEKEPKKEEKAAEEEPKKEEETKSCGEEEPKKEEKAAEEEPKDKEKPAQEEKEPADNENRNNDQKINKSNIRKMEKKYSLVKELRNAYDTGKQISLNEIQNRAFSVTDEGEDVVETELFDIVAPLRAKSVLVEAGANFVGGLKQGDIQIPIQSASNVAWASETGEAQDGSGSFDSIKLTPHRLTAIVPVTLELLAQDTIGVEEAIRRDLVNAVNDKLENTILGTSYGADQPNGLGYILADKAMEVADYGDICYMEAEVEEANVSGECKYIMSPKMKAELRGMIKGTNATGMVYEAGEVDGTAALVTSNVPSKKGFYGKWNDLYIAQFGDVTIDVVRDTAALRNGKVNLIVNSFWDCKPAHEEAFGMAYVG